MNHTKKHLSEALRLAAEHLMNQGYDCADCPIETWLCESSLIQTPKCNKSITAHFLKQAVAKGRIK